MNGKIGFDNEQYLREQTAAILERVKPVRQQALP